MGLAAVGVLESLGACAKRKEPVGPHLAVFVAGLQGFIVERVGLDVRRACRPDHCFVRIGEAPATKVGHRIRFAPDNVVENPESEILENRADSENVMIGADDHDGRVSLHHATRGLQPPACERVIFGEVRKFVPVVVDGVDDALIRAR